MEYIRVEYNPVQKCINNLVLEGYFYALHINFNKTSEWSDKFETTERNHLHTC